MSTSIVWMLITFNTIKPLTPLATFDTEQACEAAQLYVRNREYMHTEGLHYDCLKLEGVEK